MMMTYTELQTRLIAAPKTWLVTGVAGFIGSNLLETLLKLNQRVVGLDNFSTGHQCNLDEVKALVTLEQWDNFRFIDAILALTGGGPGNATRLLPVYLFDVSFIYFKLGRGGAIALTLLIVTIIFGYILVRILEDPARKKALAGETDS